MLFRCHFATLSPRTFKIFRFANKRDKGRIPINLKRFTFVLPSLVFSQIGISLYLFTHPYKHGFHSQCSWLEEKCNFLFTYLVSHIVYVCVGCYVACKDQRADMNLRTNRGNISENIMKYVCTKKT